MRAAALAVLCAIVAAGCGGGDDDKADRSPDAVKACLQDQGLKVVGAAFRPFPDATDGPDRGELITAGTFIAFYSSEEKANKLHGGISRNAKRLKAQTARHGTITVLYLRGAPRSRIERCV